MNTFEKITWIAVGAGIVALISFAAFPQTKAPVFGSVSFIQKAANSSTALLAATAAVVLPANGGRLAADVCNAGAAGNIAYLNFQSTSTGAGIKGAVLNGGTCYEINQNNLWTGPIYGYDAATTTVTTLDEQ